MNHSNSCISEHSASKARRKFQNRRLKLLRHWRDALERRISAVDASISTLEKQINRDNKKIFNISGKLRLNEWRGNKNIEFVIEDLST